MPEPVMTPTSIMGLPIPTSSAPPLARERPIFASRCPADNSSSFRTQYHPALTSRLPFSYESLNLPEPALLGIEQLHHLPCAARDEQDGRRQDHPRIQPNNAAGE